MSKNDITGDNIVSKGLSEQGREKHDWCSDGDPGPGEVMTLTCSRCGAEQKAVPSGYTAEELERDNPYNQWLY